MRRLLWIYFVLAAIITLAGGIYGLLLFQFLCVLYWLSGYLPGRPINPKLNRWQAWGPFGQIWGYIDGDKKRLLPYSMPWPFRMQFYPLTRTEYVENGKTGEYEAVSNDGQIIRYGEVETSGIYGLKKPIRKVWEMITRLRKKEVHPYLVKVNLPKAGVNFYFNLTATLEVVRPIRTRKLDEFLIFFGDELSDAVYPWGAEKERELLATHGVDTRRGLTDDEKNMIIDFMIGLRIDFAEEGIKVHGVPLKKFMTKKMSGFGLKVKEFSLDVGFDEKVKAILDARNKQTLQTEQKKLELKISDTRNVTRTREIADRTADRNQNVQDLVLYEEPLINALSNGQAKANAAYQAEVLMIGGDQTNNQVGLLTKALIDRKKKIGGKTPIDDRPDDSGSAGSSADTDDSKKKGGKHGK